MPSGYTHLSLADRALIQTQLSMGWSPAAIAAGLQRARSTITREMRRNGWKPHALTTPQGRRWGNGMYLSRKAEARAQRLRHTPRVARKLQPGTPLWNTVTAYLRSRLSPAQIASTLLAMPDPVRISYETIYTTLYAMPRGQLRTTVLRLLRRKHPKRGQRSPDRHQRAFLERMRSIDERPEDINGRLVPGHWEGDLIKGAMNRSRVGTLVERTTLFVALVKLDDGRAETTAQGFANILNRFHSPMRLSMTYDQGREMARHQWLEQQTGIKVYFAHPHSPWERGLNENTNGLLREYLPKGSDLSRFSQQDLDEIAMELNARTRKSLGWKAPAELFLPKEDFNFQLFWQDPDKLKHVALRP